MDKRKRTHKKAMRGFTLIEALVAIVLVALGVVGVFGGIRSLTAVQAKVETADLLQRLAMQKMDELTSMYTDPNSADSSGDFTDQGYPDITWTLTVEQENAENLDKLTLTATHSNPSQNDDSQSVTALVYVQPQTTTGGGAGGAGGAGGGAGQ